MGFKPDLRLDWLLDCAVPLWSGVGWDAETGTVWEALDHSGRPCRLMPRRLRVQARQAYAFAKLAGHPEISPTHAGDLKARAERLFGFIMAQGFDPDSGNLVGVLSPDLSILDAPHDLYDLSFVFLAAAGLLALGCDVREEVTRLENALDRLEAPRGWFECVGRRLPRRQNPHMHLFEAMCALYRVTGAPRFGYLAARCRAVLLKDFMQADGRLPEYFDHRLEPWPRSAQQEEPGHLVEWISLEAGWQSLDLPDAQAGGDFPPGNALFIAVIAQASPKGFLPDVAGGDTFRLWPQTELIRAGRVMMTQDATIPANYRPEAVFSRVWPVYFDTDVPGGWYDQRDARGALLSGNMPASSLYHIVEALL